MFTNSNPRRFTEFRRQAKPRNALGVMRVYVPGPAQPAGIYEDWVVGGYRARNSSEIVILTMNEGSQHLQLCKLDQKTGYCKKMGPMPEEIRCVFEQTEVNSMFFLRNIELKKLDREEIAAAIYGMPVWYVLSDELPVRERARIPLAAKMYRRSMYFSEAIENNDTRKVPTDMPDLFEDQASDLPNCSGK